MSHFAMPIEQHAKRPVHAVRPETKLPEALALMTERAISSLAVTDGNNRLLGVVTRTDLLRAGRRAARVAGRPAELEIPNEAVALSMETEVVAFDPATPLRQAATAMVEKRIHRVFVVDGGELEAVLTTRDLMDAIALQRLNKPISTFMSSPVLSVRAAEPVSLATERLEKAHVRCLLVMDGDWPVGIFTQREALGSRHLDAATPVEELMSPSILSLDARTPMYRAAAQARATRVRRVLVLDDGRVAGILTGLDFARAVAS